MPTTTRRHTLTLAGLEVPVIELTGAADGPRLTVLAGVHGCEYASMAGVRQWAREPRGAGPARPRRRGPGAEPAGVPRPHPVPGSRRRQEPQPVLPRRPGGHPRRPARVRRVHPAHLGLRRPGRRAHRRHGRGPGAVRAVRRGPGRGQGARAGQRVRARLRHPPGAGPGPGGRRLHQRGRGRGRHPRDHRRGGRMRPGRAGRRRRARPRARPDPRRARHDRPPATPDGQPGSGSPAALPVAALRGRRLVGAGRQAGRAGGRRGRCSAPSAASTAPGCCRRSRRPRPASRCSSPVPPPSPPTASSSASARPRTSLSRPRAPRPPRPPGRAAQPGPAGPLPVHLPSPASPAQPAPAQPGRFPVHSSPSQRTNTSVAPAATATMSHRDGYNRHDVTSLRLALAHRNPASPMRHTCIRTVAHLEHARSTRQGLF